MIGTIVRSGQTVVMPGAKLRSRHIAGSGLPNEVIVEHTESSTSFRRLIYDIQALVEVLKCPNSGLILRVFFVSSQNLKRQAWFGPGLCPAALCYQCLCGASYVSMGRREFS